MRTLKVFLSYSSADGLVARRLASDLRAAGIKVWLDQWALKVGEPFTQHIERGVADADFVIVLLTRKSVASEWVKREWSQKVSEEARRNQISVIPVRGEDCEIPDFLAQRSWADIAGGSYLMGLRHLLELIGHYSGDRTFELPQGTFVQIERDIDLDPIVIPISVASDKQVMLCPSLLV